MRLPQDKVREMFISWRGAKPSEDIEPTKESVLSTMSSRRLGVHLFGSWTTTENWSGASRPFVVCNADVPMRSEQFEQCRRAEQDHASVGSAGSTSNYDPDKLFCTVFAMSVMEKEWWNEHLHRSATLYLTRLKSAVATVEDGSAQLALERSLVRTATEKGTRDRSRGSRKQPRKSQEHSGPVHSRKGRTICDEFSTRLPAKCLRMP